MAAAPLVPKRAVFKHLGQLRDQERFKETHTGSGLRRGQPRRHLGTRQLDQRMFTMTQSNGSQSQGRSEGEWNAEPGDTAEKECLDGRCRLRRDGSLIVGLVVEDSGEVAGKGRNG